MKILLDECVDRNLARDLVGHDVTTVPRRGWAGIENGDLLALAEKEFDAFVTVDKKLAEQYDPSRFDRERISRRAMSNRLEDLQQHVAELLEALSVAKPALLTIVGS